MKYDHAQNLLPHKIQQNRALESTHPYSLSVSTYCALLDIQSFRIEDVGLNYHDQVPVGDAFGGFCLDLVRANPDASVIFRFLIVASGVGLQNQVYILKSGFLSRRNCDGISADLGGNLIIAVSCIGEYPSLVIRSVKRANLRNAAIVDIIRFIVIIHLHTLLVVSALHGACPALHLKQLVRSQPHSACLWDGAGVNSIITSFENLVSLCLLCVHPYIACGLVLQI